MRACRGACGWGNGPDEFVIALPSPMFANAAHCGQNVTLCLDGKNVSARVVDEVRPPPTYARKTRMMGWSMTSGLTRASSTV
jgi:hypothetical protein